MANPPRPSITDPINGPNFIDIVRLEAVKIRGSGIRNGMDGLTTVVRVEETLDTVLRHLLENAKTRGLSERP